jgi:hypothetical protein
MQSPDRHARMYIGIQHSPVFKKNTPPRATTSGMPTADGSRLVLTAEPLAAEPLRGDAVPHEPNDRDRHGLPRWIWPVRGPWIWQVHL